MANLNERLLERCEVVERDAAKLPKGILARVWYPIMRFNIKNANNRKYSKAVAEAILKDPGIKQKLETRTLYGNQEHPAESAIKLNWRETSHIISEFRIDDNVLHAAFDILPSEPGKFINILLEAGSLVGVSTRADGELEEAIDEDGSKYQRVIPEAYRFQVADFTGDPSTPNPYPEQIIKSVQNHYENHTINKNVAIALLERVKTEAAMTLEKIIKEDKQHKECKCKLTEKGCSGKCSHAKEDKVDEVIRHEGSKYVVRSHTGKNLGASDTKEEAQERLGEVEFFKHKNETKTNEELTTSSDTSGQPANLAASKEDMKKSAKRTADTDKRMQSIVSKPMESKIAENGDVGSISDDELKMRYKELSKDTHQEDKKELESVMSEIEKRKLKAQSESISDLKEPIRIAEFAQDAGVKIKQFLDDNWSEFLDDRDLMGTGAPGSKAIDAANNVAKVFNLPLDTARQYVQQLSPKFTNRSAVQTTSNEKVEPSDVPNMDESSKLAATAETKKLAEQLKTVQENYAKDVVGFANEIAALKEDKSAVVKNYSKDSIHFANEATSLKEHIVKLEENMDVLRNMNDKNVDHTNKQLAEITSLKDHVKKLLEDKAKVAKDLNEKVKVTEKTIHSMAEENKKLKEVHASEIAALKEDQLKEKINLYVEHRVKSMGLKLHENVLTLLRQCKSNLQVDSLIRETQDALREGLTQSVKLSEVVIERPIDKNQADINGKVGLALKHFNVI